MTSPRLSIITVTYNAEKYLEQTIQSVLAQTYDNFEYIVIDGGSQDSTIAIIEKYSQYLNNWISEPDKGIADAMNKGIEFAKGEYLLFLHADDYLHDKKILEKAVTYLSNTFDVFLFNVKCIFAHHTALKNARPFDWRLNFKIGFCHQGALCNRRLFSAIGHFDPHLKIAMDYDFFLRAYRKNFQSLAIPFSLATVRMSGISSQRDWHCLNKRFKEERKVHLKNCQSPLMFGMYQLYWLLYLSYRKTLDTLGITRE